MLEFKTVRIAVINVRHALKPKIIVQFAKATGDLVLEHNKSHIVRAKMENLMMDLVFFVKVKIIYNKFKDCSQLCLICI